jgi:hypothetical protein
MKLLRIKGDGQGYYVDSNGNEVSIEKINKEELLRLVTLTLQEDVEFDEYDEGALKNPAHQIVYKSIYGKLKGLRERKKEFRDESDRLYLDEYEKYRADTQQKAG